VTFERCRCWLHSTERRASRLAEELSKGRALTFREAMEIADAATEAGAWDSLC